jgi:anti-sigma B factor antagonist
MGHQTTDSSTPTVITLEGPVRAGAAVDFLRAKVEESIKAGQPRVIVDMSKVTSLDSSGIGVLVRSLAQVKQKGGALRLVGLPATVSRTLKITGVLRLFEVFPGVEDATKSFIG